MGNVHKLNVGGPEGGDGYRRLQLLSEISKGEPLSQRDLSFRLNIALGLVNAYLKNLAAKGCLKVQGIPPRRYAYYLTPKGFVEKSRLTYHYLREYTDLYREARREFRALFHGLCAAGAKRVYFAGVNEVTEIAYLSLQEAGLELVGVLAEASNGEDFFGRPVHRFAELPRLPAGDAFVITTGAGREALVRRLREAGVAREKIWSVARSRAARPAPVAPGA